MVGLRLETKSTLFLTVFFCPPRAANNCLVYTWYCITLFGQCEFLGRVDLSVAQLVAFAKEGMIHGDGKFKAKRQEWPLKNEGGAKGYGCNFTQKSTRRVIGVSCAFFKHYTLYQNLKIITILILCLNA